MKLVSDWQKDFYGIRHRYEIVHGKNDKRVASAQFSYQNHKLFWTAIITVVGTENIYYQFCETYEKMNEIVLVKLKELGFKEIGKLQVML